MGPGLSVGVKAYGSCRASRPDFPLYRFPLHAPEGRAVKRRVTENGVACAVSTLRHGIAHGPVKHPNLN